MIQNNDNKEYWTEDSNLEWYTRQFKNPYQITIAFENFLSQNVNLDGANIIDIGCGPGSALDYISQKHPTSDFLGIDINTKLFELYSGKSKNISFAYGDVFNLDSKYINIFDGIVSLQVLSWLPEFVKPLEEMCKLNADWIAFSSLLYDGKINYTISLQNYEKPTHKSPFSQVFYNIYSVPIIQELFSDYGYRHFIYKPFEIDIDINKPNHKNLGYYTIKTQDNKRLAFNTCLYQPEGFIFASK